MIPTPDANAITHGIQLAIAPVFLLTAVAGMIGAVAARLARVIDRARLLEERVQAGLDGAAAQRARAELAALRTRRQFHDGLDSLFRRDHHCQQGARFRQGLRPLAVGAPIRACGRPKQEARRQFAPSAG